MGDTSTKPAVRPAEDENSVVQEISILLRDGRLDQGESIEEVARTLRINKRYLEAIEDGRFGELPGPVYAIGFIRSFGDHVGLDGEELVRRFKSVSSTTSKRAELEFPEPIPESGVPGGAVLFAGLLVAVLAYGGWYMMSADDNILSELVAPVPEQLSDPAGSADAPEVISNADEEPVIPEEPAPAAPEPQVEPETAGDEPNAETEAVAETAGNPVPDGQTDGQADSQADSQADVQEGSQTAIEPEPAEPVGDTGSQSPDTGATESATGEPAAEEPAATETAAAPEPEPVPEPETEPEPETAPEAAASGATVAEDETIAQSLNEAQLQAMQADMIDVPSIQLQGSSEPAAEEAAEVAEPETAQQAVPEPQPEPEPEPVAEPETVEQAALPESDAPAEEDTGSASSVAATASDYPDEGVVIVAREDSWIEVRDSVNNDIVVAKVLRAGERFAVPRVGEFELATGNAGALSFVVDGEELPPLGGGGQIGRNIRLDAESLLERQGATGR
ncbi:MAG: DUF4115 domain-containing protein [Rhodospirillales bacterium]